MKRLLSTSFVTNLSELWKLLIKQTRCHWFRNQFKRQSFIVFCFNYKSIFSQLSFRFRNFFWYVIIIFVSIRCIFTHSSIPQTKLSKFQQLHLSFNKLRRTLMRKFVFKGCRVWTKSLRRVLNIKTFKFQHTIFQIK